MRRRARFPLAPDLVPLTRDRANAGGLGDLAALAQIAVSCSAGLLHAGSCPAAPCPRPLTQIFAIAQLKTFVRSELLLQSRDVSWMYFSMQTGLTQPVIGRNSGIISPVHVVLLTRSARTPAPGSGTQSGPHFLQNLLRPVGGVSPPPPPPPHPTPPAPADSDVRAGHVDNSAARFENRDGHFLDRRPALACGGSAQVRYTRLTLQPDLFCRADAQHTGRVRPIDVQRRPPVNDFRRYRLCGCSWGGTFRTAAA